MCAGLGTAHHPPARPTAPGPMSSSRPDVTLQISAWLSNKENNGTATGTFRQCCCLDPHTQGLLPTGLPVQGHGVGSQKLLLQVVLPHAPKFLTCREQGGTLSHHVWRPTPNQSPQAGKSRDVPSL